MSRTKEQQRLYMRDYRARQRAEAEGVTEVNVTRLGAVRNSGSTDFVVYESVEDAVRAEIKNLPLAADRPSEVSAALRLAQILDDRSASNRVQAADKLRLTMDVLRGGGSHAVNPLRRLEARRGAG